MSLFKFGDFGEYCIGKLEKNSDLLGVIYDENYINEVPDKLSDFTDSNVQKMETMFKEIDNGRNYALLFVNNHIDICFPDGTLIDTPKGFINIEDIKVGDCVYTYNEENKTIEAKEVISTAKNCAEKMLNITDDESLISTTVFHTFYVKDNGWKRADTLKVGDEVITKDGENIKIVSIAEDYTETKVYNFIVKDNHNYFVGESKLLVQDYYAILKNNNLIN